MGKKLFIPDRKTPSKRKRGSISLEGSPIMGHQNMSKTPGAGSRSVPLSERQQLAMIMRMADESTHGVLPVPEQGILSCIVYKLPV